MYTRDLTSVNCPGVGVIRHDVRPRRPVASEVERDPTSIVGGWRCRSGDLPLASTTIGGILSRAARSDRGPRGLGVDEDTVHRWEMRGLIKATLLPSGVRRVVSQELAAIRGGPLTGFPEAREEDMPAVHVREIAAD